MGDRQAPGSRLGLRASASAPASGFGVEAMSSVRWLCAAS